MQFQKELIYLFPSIKSEHTLKYSVNDKAEYVFNKFFLPFFNMYVYYITLNWKSFLRLTNHSAGSMCHIKAFFQQVLEYFLCFIKSLH